MKYLQRVTISKTHNTFIKGVTIRLQDLICTPCLTIIMTRDYNVTDRKLTVLVSNHEALYEWIMPPYLEHYCQIDENMTSTIRIECPIFDQHNVSISSTVKWIIYKYENDSVGDVKHTRARRDRSPQNIIAVCESVSRDVDWSSRTRIGHYYNNHSSASRPFPHVALLGICLKRHPTSFLEC